MAANEFDLIIVGAGLIGCSVALALQQQGLKIALLEKHLPNFTAKSDATFRPISLAYSSVNILQSLGVWQPLAAQASPIKTVHVSEQAAFGRLCFNAAEQQVDALGQVVSFDALHRELYQTLCQQNSVEILPIITLQHITHSAHQTTLSVTTEKGLQHYCCNLLIGADGTQSSVRHLLNIPTATQLTDDTALTATLSSTTSHSAMAFERFTKAGTLALLPLLSPYQRGFVWTIPNANVDTIKQWSDDQLGEFVAQQFGQHLSTITTIKRSSLWPLQTIMAKQPVLAGAILLGNAAHTLYPLAAQGFNLGLRDAAALAEVLVAAKQSSEALGSLIVLQRYSDWRLAEQRNIARLTKHIASASALQLPLASCFRGAGLLLTDLLPPLKNRIAQLTMGLSGRLPKLARGISLW